MRSLTHLLVFTALIALQGNASADVDLDDIKLPRGFAIEVYDLITNPPQIT